MLPTKSTYSLGLTILYLWVLAPFPCRRCVDFNGTIHSRLISLFAQISLASARARAKRVREKRVEKCHEHLGLASWFCTKISTVISPRTTTQASRCLSVRSEMLHYYFSGGAPAERELRRRKVMKIRPQKFDFWVSPMGDGFSFTFSLSLPLRLSIFASPSARARRDAPQRNVNKRNSIVVQKHVIFAALASDRFCEADHAKCARNDEHECTCDGGRRGSN